MTTGLIVLGLILIGIFGARAVVSFIRIQQTGLQPGGTDVEAIRGWMTVPYIATAYGVRKSISLSDSISRLKAIVKRAWAS